MSKSMEDIKLDLIEMVKHMRYAVAEAKKEGSVQFGVIAKHIGGGGRVVSTFDCEEFVKDLAVFVGAPPETEADKTKVSAIQFSQINKLQ